MNKTQIKKVLHFAVVAAWVILVSGCASTEYLSDERDPWQGYNRNIYAFNDSLDRAILKPAAKGYQYIAPDFVETGVRNFFENINDVSIAVNNLLQGKLNNSASDVGRILINSTIGVLGLFDVASSMGLRKHDEDFGQTLAVWGADSGPYLVWPLFGPSTLRDSPSIVVDGMILDPFSLIEPNLVELRLGERIAMIALDVVSIRAELLSLEDTVNEISTDRYAFIRDAYLDRREFLIHDGAPPVDLEIFDELDE